MPRKCHPNPHIRAVASLGEGSPGLNPSPKRVADVYRESERSDHGRAIRRQEALHQCPAQPSCQRGLRWNLERFFCHRRTFRLHNHPLFEFPMSNLFSARPLPQPFRLPPATQCQTLKSFRSIRNLQLGQPVFPSSNRLNGLREFVNSTRPAALVSKPEKS